MLKKLAPYTRGYGLYILLGVLCSVGESVLELELPQAMSEIVDVGIANGDRSYILLTGLKMFLMAMAALLCGALRLADEVLLIEDATGLLAGGLFPVALLLVRFVQERFLGNNAHTFLLTCTSRSRRS